MSDNKNVTVDTDKAVSIAAQAAEELEQAAGLQTDIGSYTHTFKTPFTYNGRTFEQMSFNWEGLTGNDSLAIEAELRTHGITLVIPAYTGEYLAGMAARSCTDRDEKGNRVVGSDTIRAMPLADFQAVCGRARTFLLRLGR